MQAQIWPSTRGFWIGFSRKPRRRLYAYCPRDDFLAEHSGLERVWVEGQRAHFTFAPAGCCPSIAAASAYYVSFAFIVIMGMVRCILTGFRRTTLDFDVFFLLLDVVVRRRRASCYTVCLGGIPLDLLDMGGATKVVPKNARLQLCSRSSRSF